MKAKELMIGDWVKVIEPDRYAGAQGTILSLTSREGGYYEINISDVNYGYLTTDVFNEDIEPVPLTDEILQKHFPDTTDGVIWHPTNNPGKYEIIIPHKTDRGETSCYINYVHELQQILKICGIKKDIEL